MPYTITYSPRNPIAGVKPKTVCEDTAAAAWALIQQLDASDEKADIKNPLGHPISWEELRAQAAKEAN